jgi:hypothetical protein
MNKIQKPIYYDSKTWNNLNNLIQKNKTKNIDICTICYESTKKMSKWTRLSKGLSTVEIQPENLTLKCNHIFHTPCILKWLDSNNTCPNCREII